MITDGSHHRRRSIFRDDLDNVVWATLKRKMKYQVMFSMTGIFNRYAWALSDQVVWKVFHALEDR
jgi:hypothetical protein